MPDPYLGEIKLVSWSFATRDWAFCDGRALSVQQNQPLFKLLGTTYGGDGVNFFNLPDLRGRAAMHFTQKIPLGLQMGQPTHTLSFQEVPQHTHALLAATPPGRVGNVAAAQWLAGITDGQQGFGYAPPPSNPQQLTTLAPSSIATTGAGQAHENRQPYLCLNYVIATAGIYPSRG